MNRHLLGVMVAALLLLVTPVRGAELVLSQVGPLSGLEAAMGRAYAAGVQLHLESVNRSGGVNGHSFKLVRRDDAGRPEDTVALTKMSLEEERPIALVGYVGSKGVGALLTSGLLDKNRVPLVGFRTPDITPGSPFLFNVRAGLEDEIHRIAEHLAIIGINRLGLFYEEGIGAAGVVAVVEQATSRTKGEIIARGRYAAGTASVGQAVDAFIKRPPQAIIMVSSSPAAAAFIEQYKAAGGAAQLFASSGVDIEQLSKRLSEEQMQGVAIAQVTPSPYRITSRISKEFTDAVAKAKDLEVPVSFPMLEGYIASKVVVEAIRRQGKTVTREGTLNALSSMDAFDVGGFVVGFKGGKSSGSRYVDLSIISSAGRVRQ